NCFSLARIQNRWLTHPKGALGGTRLRRRCSRNRQVALPCRSERHEGCRRPARFGCRFKPLIFVNPRGEFGDAFVDRTRVKEDTSRPHLPWQPKSVILKSWLPPPSLSTNWPPFWPRDPRSARRTSSDLRRAGTPSRTAMWTWPFTSIRRHP